MQQEKGQLAAGSTIKAATGESAASLAANSQRVTGWRKHQHEENSKFADDRQNSEKSEDNSKLVNTDQQEDNFEKATRGTADVLTAAIGIDNRNRSTGNGNSAIFNKTGDQERVLESTKEIKSVETLVKMATSAEPALDWISDATYDRIRDAWYKDDNGGAECLVCGYKGVARRVKQHARQHFTRHFCQFCLQK